MQDVQETDSSIGPVRLSSPLEDFVKVNAKQLLQSVISFIYFPERFSSREGNSDSITKRN